MIINGFENYDVDESGKIKNGRRFVNDCRQNQG